MAREIQEHRAVLRRLDERVRDLEEAIKLLAQEHRYARNLEAVEREKLLLTLERELAQRKLPRAKKRK